MSVIDTRQQHHTKRAEVDCLIEKSLGSHERYVDSLLSAILVELRRVVDYITLPELRDEENVDKQNTERARRAREYSGKRSD